MAGAPITAGSPLLDPPDPLLQLPGSIDAVSLFAGLPDPPVLAQLLVLGLLLGGVYGIVSLGLTIIFGVMDVVNVAHGAFAVVGMYAVWFVHDGLGASPFLGIPLAAVVLFAGGVAIQRALLAPVMEGGEDSKFLVTLALLIILIAAVEVTFEPDPRVVDVGLGSIEVAGVYVLEGQLYAMLIGVATFAATWAFLKYTHTGRAIRGTADNRESAAYAGIDIRRIDYLTFGLGAGLAGLAGALVALIQPFDPYLGNEYLTVAFVVVVLGGLGSVPGALAGGLIIGMVHVFGSFFLPGSYYQILILIVFVLVLLFKPSGLMGDPAHE